MVLRGRRILDIGTGPRAKKGVDLALRHPRSKIVAIDYRSDVAYKKYLKSLGVKSKPKNLIVKRNQEALKYLLKQPSNSFDIFSLHFVLQHQSIERRGQIFKQAMRVLRPGGKMFSLTEHSFFGQEAFELRKNGFKVSVNPLSFEEVLKINTDHTLENIKGGKYMGCGAIDLDKVLKAEAIKLNIPLKEIQKIYSDIVILPDLENYIQKREGPLVTQIQKDMGKRVKRDERLRFTDKRYVLLVATKPRVRYVGPSGAHTTSHSLKRTIQAQ